MKILEEAKIGKLLELLFYQFLVDTSLVQLICDFLRITENKNVLLK